MSKGDKIIRSIYVYEKLWAKAKEEGINISELVNNVLEELLGDTGEMELMKLEEEIKKKRQELLTLEMKRQHLLKIQAEKQKERNREAELYKLMNEHLKLKEQTIKATTQDEINRMEKEQMKLFNEIIKVAGVQRGTPEFYTFAKLVNQGKIEDALNLARALWAK